MTGASILHFRNAGIWFDDTDDSRLSGSLIDAGGEAALAVKVSGGRNNAVVSNSIRGRVEADDEEARVDGNQIPRGN